MKHLTAPARGAQQAITVMLVSAGVVVPPILSSPAPAQVFAGAPTEQAAGLNIAVDPADLATPYATANATNFSQSTSFPAAPTLAVPNGFAVNIFARTGLTSARNLMVAPNGDVFVAEQSAGRVTLLRDADGDGRAEVATTFASNFSRPYGLAMTATDLYVADVNAVWRLPYTAGATAATSRTQITANGALSDAQGHDTRNLVLSPAGDRLYIAIGSRGNIGEEASPRATIQEVRLDGTGLRTYASGLRNPVGMAFAPGTSSLFTVVNERDGMGDELVPDYLAQVVDGGFYGWPYSYIGGNVQPNFAPSLTANGQARIASARVPELLFRSHSSPLGIAFASGTRLPADYRNGVFVALHGSWNAAVPRGYMVVFAPFSNGQPSGGYRIFASGFWASGVSRATVIGRPSAVAMAKDGSVLIADDVANAVWRVSSTTGATTMFGVAPSSAPGAQSFIRLHNGGSAAGTVTLSVRHGVSGAMLGSWTSPSLPPRASLQVGVAAIEAGATPAITAAGSTPYVIEIRSGIDGAVQHVAWDATAGTLENMTRCDSAPASDLKTLINVHTSQIANYPSLIRIYNAGSIAASAQLTLADAMSGAVLTTWSSPTIEPGAMLETAMAAIEAAIALPAGAMSQHVVLTLDPTFPGALQHLVRGPTNIVTNVTDRCVITQ